jgi:amidase
LAGRLLARRGHRVEPADAGRFLSTEAIEEQLAIRNCANVAATLDGWCIRTGRTITEADVEPTTWEMAQRGRAHSAPELAGALSAIQSHGRRLSNWLAASFDVLLSPTMAEPPPPIGDFRRDPNPLWPLERARPFTAFTLPFNVSGGPAISLPLHWSAEGSPIGVQLAAPYGREDRLLRLAKQLELDHPWAHRRPALLDDEGNLDE